MSTLYTLFSDYNKTIAAKIITYNYNSSEHVLIHFNSTLIKALFCMNFENYIKHEKFESHHQLYVQDQIVIMMVDTFEYMKAQIKSIMDPSYSIEQDTICNENVINEIKQQIKKLPNPFFENKLTYETRSCLEEQPIQEEINSNTTIKKLIEIKGGIKSNYVFYEFNNNRNYLEDLSIELILLTCKKILDDPETNIERIDYFLDTYHSKIFTEKYFINFIWIIEFQNFLDRYFSDLCKIDGALFEIDNYIKSLPDISKQIKLNCQIAELCRKYNYLLPAYQFNCNNINFINPDYLNLHILTEFDLDLCFSSLLNIKNMEHRKEYPFSTCIQEYNILVATYNLLLSCLESGNISIIRYALGLNLILINYIIEHGEFLITTYQINLEPNLLSLLDKTQKYLAHINKIDQEILSKDSYNEIYTFFLILGTTYNGSINNNTFTRALDEAKNIFNELKIDYNLSKYYYEVAVRLNRLKKKSEAKICFDFAIKELCTQNIIVSYDNVMYILEDYLKYISANSQHNVSNISKFLKNSLKQYSNKNEKQYIHLNNLKKAYQKQLIITNHHSRLFKQKRKSEVIIDDHELTASKKQKTNSI